VCLVCVKLNARPVRRTEDVHHSAGKLGDRLLDDTKWIPVCREHHEWIHSHIEEARRLGLIAGRGDWNRI